MAYLNWMDFFYLRVGPFNVSIRWPHVAGVSYLETVPESIKRGNGLNFVHRYYSADDSSFLVGSIANFECLHLISSELPGQPLLVRVSPKGQKLDVHEQKKDRKHSKHAPQGKRIPNVKRGI